MKVYISCPKSLDKTEIEFIRVPARKRQKKIKISGA